VLSFIFTKIGSLEDMISGRGLGDVRFGPVLKRDFLQNLKVLKRMEVIRIAADDQRILQKPRERGDEKKGSNKETNARESGCCSSQNAIASV